MAAEAKQKEALDAIELARVYAASGARVSMTSQMVMDLCALARFGVTAHDTIDALVRDAEDLDDAIDKSRAELRAIKAQIKADTEAALHGMTRTAIWFTLTGIAIGIAVGEMIREWGLM